MLDLEDKLSDLLDDRQFQEINQQFGRFNLFEAIGGVRRELAHSNFLAFLLSPDRPHGLGIEFLRRLIRAILEPLPKDKRPISVLDIATGDLDDAVIYRERENIDVLIELRELRLVVAIENKVGAKASEGQLARYEDVVERLYAGWRHLFVFLTPDGADPEHANYVPVTYSHLASVLDGLLEGSPPSPEVEIALRHYLEMLRRHVVQDERLKEVALKIYERHKEALDFIFSCRPEAGSLLGAATSVVEDHPMLVSDRNIASMSRFVPANWAAYPALNACPADVWTKTGRNLVFEIKPSKNENGDFTGRVQISLILGPSDQALREHFYKGARSQPTIFPGCTSALGKHHATIFAKELLSANAAKAMDEEERVAALRASLLTFVDDDLPRISDALISLSGSAPPSLHD
jgi:hypothetical protein